MAAIDDIEIPSLLLAEQAAAPATPASGFGRLFAKPDGLYFIDDAGAVTGPLGAGGGGSSTPANCRLTKSADQPYAAGATAAVSFDGEAFDTGLHDNATNNTRITNTTGGTRRFQVGGAVQFGTAAYGQLLAQVNGTTPIPGGSRSNAANSGLILPATIVELAAGGYVEMIFANDVASPATTVRGGASPVQVHASFWATTVD